jgi:hypothetical protein
MSVNFNDICVVGLAKATKSRVENTTACNSIEGIKVYQYNSIAPQ